MEPPKFVKAIPIELGIDINNVLYLKVKDYVGVPNYDVYFMIKEIEGKLVVYSFFCHDHEGKYECHNWSAYKRWKDYPRRLNYGLVSVVYDLKRHITEIIKKEANQNVLNK